MRKVKTYASYVAGGFGMSRENFGDNLMEPILRYFFSLEPEYVDLAQAELLGIGSILDAYWRRKRYRESVSLLRRRPWRTLHVWGSGFMDTHSVSVWPQRLVFHALRGPLSRQRLLWQIPDSLVLGDPALLLPLMWEAPSSKSYAVGLIPHFATRDAFTLRHGSLPRNWHVIDMQDDPAAIARKIATSEVVISSSLHGLIVADAYGVPSFWMKPHSPIGGDGFKFADYFAFRGKPLRGPHTLDEFLDGKIDLRTAEPVVPKAADLAKLIRAFPEF